MVEDRSSVHSLSNNFNAKVMLIVVVRKHLILFVELSLIMVENGPSVHKSSNYLNAKAMLIVVVN